MPETILSRTSLSSFPSVTPLTSTQTQLDSLVSHFVEEAANPQTLAAITAGGFAFRLGRIGALAMSQEAPLLRLASYGVGLGSEVTAFEFTNRTFASLRATDRSPLQENPNLWNWS